ncbi:MAG: hypothetical protein HUJ26_23125 [Planctomycetaceae bacterium]|nr:hypothetical protein [Planctomycetaceae bacterium]
MLNNFLDNMKSLAVSDRITTIGRTSAFVLIVGVWALLNPLRAEELPPLPEAEPQILTTPRIANSDPQSSLIPTTVFPLGEESLRVEPYGSLWGNIYYSTSRTNPGPFTLWVRSEEDQGESSLDVDARRSRIGARLFGESVEVGPEIFQTRGRVEVDFFGQFLTENRAGVRLRHVYWEVESESSRYLIGQTDDVISPLLPGTLNFAVGRSAGNLGFRRAQFQAEKTYRLGKHSKLILQGSLNQDIVDDFPTDPGIRRESVDWPVIESRVAVQFESPLASERPATVGFSGHLGETGFDFLASGPPPLSLPPADDVRIKTWSINVDFEIPLSEVTTFRGEWFRGANLSPFLGGIGQGVCPCLRRPIHSDGGWFELDQQWNPVWESHFGAGIDDPEDEDSLLGRTQNSFVFGNLIFQVNDRLSTGWEVTWWKTLYHDERAGLIPAADLTPRTPGEAVTLEWMVRYNF